jgi:hypothetical protein
MEIMNKKGFGLTLDAVISVIFILAISIGISTFQYTNMSDTTTAAFITLHYVTEDVMDVLNKKGILDDIGEAWTDENTSLAANISAEYLDQLVPTNMGYRLLFDGNTVYENIRVSEANSFAQTHSMRLLAGYTENETSEGSVARAFLNGIEGKDSAAYAYFGGFVGQGNLTKYLYVPAGVTITGAYMEMDAGAQFNMFVNSQACENPHSPGAGALTANIKEYIDNCSFNIGQNTIEIEFSAGASTEWYMGGGFIKVSYNTTLLNESAPGSSETFEFPGIDGFINYYSSFYVPGSLQTMDLHLEFDNEYVTFLKIGDVLVFNSSGSNLTQVVDLSDAQLQTKLNYNTLSDNTIPIRLGTSNISETIEEGNADVILITDVSGSMMWQLNDSSQDGTIRGCDDSNLLDGNTRRISLAKCLDKDFIDIILNSTGNRVGLVSFESNEDSTHSLSTDYNSLIAEIDDYSDNPSGGTCICCAINSAYNMLNLESSPEKNKYIIVMSDGIAGYCCGITGWWWWASCDDEGTSTLGRFLDCGGGSEDCLGAQCDGAISNAIWSAERSNLDLGAIVNTIGFGPVEDCTNANYTMTQMAIAGNGTYCASTNATKLQNCYVNFAEDIVNGSIQSQIVNLSGAVTASELYPSSYISYTYNPIAPPLEYGEIMLSYDTERFNDNVTCQGYFFIPEGVEVIDAKATSYSSEHWTHYMYSDNSGGIRTNFKLSDFGSNYYTLGDPFIVQIRSDYIESGENNTIKLTTGDSADNATGCSIDNRAIITIKMAGAVEYGNVFSYSEGCNWDIEFEDSSTASAPIPDTYVGNSNCSYTTTNISYVSNDAMVDAIKRVLEKLDLDSDGAVDIKFDPTQMEFDLSGIGGVRSLWGPAQLKLVVWI